MKFICNVILINERTKKKSEDKYCVTLFNAQINVFNKIKEKSFIVNDKIKNVFFNFT